MLGLSVKTMYKGVLRDEERVAKKKAQREEEYRISLAKRERYEAVQPIATPNEGQLEGS